MWTTGATGDGATAYTQAEVIRWLRQTFIGDDDEGVHKDYLNELVTTGATSPVATNTGAANVHGFPYWNTTSKDTAIPTPSGNTRIDRLVLRAGWAAQTTRITRIAGTEGAGAPAIVQTDGTTWDNKLYQVSITTGGNITLTDEREFLHPNIAVDGDMLDDDAVDSQHYVDGSIDKVHLAADIVDGTKIEDDAVDSEHIVTGAVDLAHMSPNSVDSDQYVDGSIDLAHLSADSVDDTKAGNRVPQFYRRQGGEATGWLLHGTTTYTPGAVRMQAGCIRWTGGAASSGYIAVTFPVAFSYDPLVFATHYYIDSRAICIVMTTGTSGLTIYWQDAASATYTSLDFFWLAIGPE